MKRKKLIITIFIIICFAVATYIYFNKDKDDGSEKLKEKDLAKLTYSEQVAYIVTLLKQIPSVMSTYNQEATAKGKGIDEVVTENAMWHLDRESFMSLVEKYKAAIANL